MFSRFKSTVRFDKPGTDPEERKQYFMNLLKKAFLKRIELSREEIQTSLRLKKHPSVVQMARLLPSYADTQQEIQKQLD